MTTFTDVFNAGLWDAPADKWVAFVHSLCAEGSVVKVTETTHQHPRPPAHFGQVWFGEPGAFECSLYLDEREWQVVAGAAPQIASTRYALGGSGLKPALHALIVMLEHKVTGERVTHAVIHWPSAIEAIVSRDHDGAHAKFPRIVALFQGLSGLRGELRAFRKAHGHSATVISADWNLDFHKAWVRAFIKAHFPGLKSSWHSLPTGGDEGKRLISASLHSRHLTTKGSRLGRHFAPFDHARFTTVYGFRKAHKRRKP